MRLSELKFTNIMEESKKRQETPPSGQTAGSPAPYEEPRCEVVGVRVEAGFQSSLPAGHEGFGDGDADPLW